MAHLTEPRGDLLSEHTRMSILCWNPRPNAGLQVPLKTTSLGDGSFPWLRHVHTFEPGIEIMAIYIPAGKGYCTGWIFEGVLSRVRFRRIPRNGKSPFTVMSLHCQNAVGKKRSIASNIPLVVRFVMLHVEDVDMVAGDFNGASWRYTSGPYQQFDGALEEAFKNARLLVPPGP